MPFRPNVLRLAAGFVAPRGCRRPVLSLLALLTVVCASARPGRADPPPGYYNPVDSSTPALLRATLHGVIDDHTRFPYTASSTDTWTILEIADQDPANSGRILDLYRNRSLAKIGGGTGPYNREHTWPNSLGFPNDGGTNYPYTDCHHLFLCDVSYNSDRGNKPYGDVPAGSTERVTDVNNGHGGGSGVYPGNSNWFTASYWQTWGSRKGDVARAMFYMDIRYEGGTHGVTGASEPNLMLTDNPALIVTTGSNASVAYMGLLADLIEWSAADPPDALERAHNDAVYSFQGNRNPFVDHPEWVSALYVTSTGPTLASILDVPADQGGELLVSWERNSLDVAGSVAPIDYYVVQRLAGTWVDAGTRDADQSLNYSLTISTPDIATPSNPTPTSQYRVVAVETGGFGRASGSTGAFSIDNVAPPAPLVTLDESGTPRILSWGSPAIPDFDMACVYRGDTPGFTPTTPLACVTTGDYEEFDLSLHYYRVRFTDTHGNAGPFSDEIASGASGVGDTRPMVTALTGIAPNPCSPRARVAFSLAEAGPVRIDLFSAQGRFIRSLLDEQRATGAFQVDWDGTDRRGEPVASGSYFVRFRTARVVETRKLLLVR